MGLKDYRKYKRNQEFLAFFAAFGITEDDLRYLPAALKAVKDMKSRADSKPIEAKPVPSEEQKKAFKKKQEEAVKPEDIVKMFANDVEEFYPNGRQES